MTRTPTLSQQSDYNTKNDTAGCYESTQSMLAFTPASLNVAALQVFPKRRSMPGAKIFARVGGSTNPLGCFTADDTPQATPCREGLNNRERCMACCG